MIEQVLILAAGQGTRMRPLTDDTPKPLIEVNGRSMLDRILDRVNKIQSVKNIVINGFYLADQVEDYVNSLNDDRIKFSKEETRIETGGALIQALPLFDQEKPILIINGDIVWQDDEVLKNIITNYDAMTDILVGLKSKNEFLGYDGKGDFNMDEQGNLSQKEDNKFVYTGIQILHPRILKSVNFPKPPFSLSFFFQNTKDKGIVLKGTKLPSVFYHIGTPKDLEKYQGKIDGYKK